MTNRDLIPIIARLVEKGGKAQARARTALSGGSGIIDSYKAVKAKPLSYEKTKNYAKASGAFNGLPNSNHSRARRMIDWGWGVGTHKGIELDTAIHKGLYGKLPTKARNRFIGNIAESLGVGGVRWLAPPKLSGKAAENELKRLGALTGIGMAGGATTASALGALEKTSSWKVQMSPAQAIVSGTALAGLIGSKLKKANNARKFLSKGVSNKPLDVLLNRNAINANKLRGTRPGLGYNKKLDDLASKENLKSTIARLGLGTTVGAGAYAGVTN